MKTEDIENLTKMIAHLNCALEHLDQVSYQRVFKQNDKLVMNRFLNVAKRKAEPLIDKMYENDEVYFQVLQTYFQESLDKSLITIFKEEAKKQQGGEEL